MNTELEEEQESQDIQDNQVRKAKAGRPRKDYSNEIGRIYGRSQILSIVDGPRSRVGVEVIAECLDCGTQYRTRLRRLKSGETRTCSCLKKQNFRNYIANLVAKLPDTVVEGCWISRFNGMNRKQTAAKYRLYPIAVVDVAHRKYQSILDALIERGTARKMYLRATTKADGKYISIQAIAEEFGVPAVAAQYMISAAAKPVRIEKGFKRFQARFVSSWAPAIVDEVVDRSNSKQWPRKYYPGELTRKEFRREKGELKGKRALLYIWCEAVDRSLLDEEAVKSADAFIEIAKNTLSNRRERRTQKAREIYRSRLSDSVPLAA